MYRLTPEQLIEIFKICAKSFRENIDNSESQYIKDCQILTEKLLTNPVVFQNYD